MMSNELFALFEEKKQKTPTLPEIIEILGIQSDKRTIEMIHKLEMFFGENKFFKEEILQKQGLNALWFCLSKMTYQKIPIGGYATWYKEIGNTYCVIISGSLDIYTPQNETFSFNAYTLTKFVIE